MTDEDDPPTNPTNPTKDQPLNGPRRPRVKPLIWLLALVVVLIALYYVGVNVLIPAG